MRVLCVAVLGCGLLPLTMAGCTGANKEAEPELVPVSGTVTLDGKPIEGVSVMFGGLSFGESDANGHYELKYHGEKPGVPVGEHLVVCEKWVMPDGSVYRSAEETSPMAAGATQALPGKYASTESGLKKTVPPGGGTIDIALVSGAGGGGVGTP